MPKKSPYDILGVAPDATPQDIKKAYRCRAMQSHPDKKEGDPAEFQQVHEAYLILRNPDRRKKFDETGDTQSPENFQKLVHTELMKWVCAAVANINWKEEDLVKNISAAIDKKIDQHRAQKEKHLQAAADFNMASKRATRRDHGPNLIQITLENEFRGFEEQARCCDKNIELLEAIKAELDHYCWRTDPRAQQPLYRLFPMTP